MPKKTTFTVLIFVVFFVFIVGTAYFFTKGAQLNKENVADKSFGWKFPASFLSRVTPAGELPPLFDVEISPGRYLAYSTIRDPGGVPQGLPMRLKIPSIGVDSAIEDAYITADGRMDVPAGTVNVAWFALGPHPGKEGSAVIGGHYGRYEANKGPTVFYNLDKLKSGDKIYIEDDKGDTLAFIVRKISLFDRDADATTVFTSSDGLAHLNLITCEGAWNQVNDSYPDRRVVFTDAIPSEGAIIVPKSKIGKVAAPTIPTYPPAGSSTISPIPMTQDVITTVSPTPQILIASAKTLYATPTDGVITSFLLLSIVFVGVKILKRI